LRDKGVLMIFVAAPLFYAFFYPWFFGPEVVTRIPVAVVDQDHSALSRSIHRLALANPRIEVKAVGADERAAQAAMSRGEIDGYLVLPDDLKAHVARGMPAMVTVVSNGAYPLISKAVQAARGQRTESPPSRREPHSRGFPGHGAVQPYRRL